MSEFDNREKAFEKKFEIDQELKFKADVRAARLFGQWVAVQMGLSGAEADAYALQVVDADLSQNGHDDIMAKVEQDLIAKGKTISRHSLEKEFSEFMRVAHEQVIGTV